MFRHDIPTGSTSTRRTVLLNIGLMGCAAGVLGALTVPGSAAAATKLSAKAAGYRDKPMGKASCQNCGVWQAPASCKLVDGQISPAGWCNLYNAK
jgi:hypothetical protein